MDDQRHNLVTFAPSKFAVNGETYPLDYKTQRTIQLIYPKEHAWLLLKIEKLSSEFKVWRKSLLQTKKQIIKTIAVSYILLALLITIITLYKMGNKKIASLIPVVLVIISSIWLYQQLKQPENIVLTSYEIDALTALRNAHKKVVYLAPDQSVEYRARAPFIYAKPYLAEKLSNTRWQYYTRKKDEPVKLTIDSNSIILVPRYLGQELHSNEIVSLNVIKIFDNAQIELYEKR